MTVKSMIEYVDEDWKGWGKWDPHSVADADIERWEELQAVMRAVVALTDSSYAERRTRKLANQLWNVFKCAKGAMVKAYQERAKEPPSPEEPRIMKRATAAMNDWETFRADCLAHLERRRMEVATFAIRTGETKFGVRAFGCYDEEEDGLRRVFTSARIARTDERGREAPEH